MYHNFFRIFPCQCWNCSLLRESQHLLAHGGTSWHITINTSDNKWRILERWWIAVVDEDVGVWWAMMQKERACVKMRIWNKMRPFPDKLFARKRFALLPSVSLWNKVCLGAITAIEMAKCPSLSESTGFSRVEEESRRLKKQQEAATVQQHHHLVHFYRIAL